jgi:hypothetical protein
LEIEEGTTTLLDEQGQISKTVKAGVHLESGRKRPLL